MKLFLFIFLTLGSIVLGLVGIFPIFWELRDSSVHLFTAIETHMTNFYIFLFSLVVLATCVIVIILKFLESLVEGFEELVNKENKEDIPKTQSKSKHMKLSEELRNRNKEE